jgi:phenylpyruvate tautomerase PptA (4-oxalocrotonate tautomerase family)
MPIVRVEVPSGVYDAATTEELIRAVSDAAATAEQMPDDPEHRIGLIVLWDERPAGSIRSNGIDPVGIVAPVFVWMHPPEGVVDDHHVDQLAATLQSVFEQAAAQAVTVSLVVSEVPDGRWGIGGQLQRLPDFARRAGYAHLQHLVT